jgi:hypothetical protein
VERETSKATQLETKQDEAFIFMVEAGVATVVPQRVKGALGVWNNRDHQPTIPSGVKPMARNGFRNPLGRIR